MSTRVLVAASVAVGCLLAAAGAVLVARLGQLGVAPHNAGIGDVIGSLGFLFAGAYLARRRPANPVGWLLVGIGLTEELSNVTIDYGTLGHRLAGRLPLTDWVLWAGSWLWLPGFLALGTVLLQLYPDARISGGRDRWLLRATSIAGAGLTLALAVAPESVRDADNPTAVNPVGAPQLSTVLAWVSGPVLAGCLVLSIAVFLRRLWLAPAPLRQQLAWLLTAVLVTGVAKWFVSAEWLSSGSLALIPVAIAVGVLRYRLLGIETAVRRTLLYLPLTVAVALVFAAMTAAAALALPDGPLPHLVAAVVVVFGIAPARAVLQRGVDRLVRGPRVDPFAVVAGVGQAALTGDDAGLVERVLASLGSALHSEYVAVVDDEGRPLASWGRPGAEQRQVRLRYADRTLGTLTVGGQPDPELLTALAAQVAVVVRAVALNADLDAARQQAVGAALVERGRLRRDLHDGLGPSLSGVALGLEAASARLDGDPAAAQAMLTRVRDEVAVAVTEVHRLLEGLRPPELATFGLAAALRERLTLPGAGPTVTVTAPAALPPLDPRVELAAFRIVSEAVTNVRRHAGASRCEVSLGVCRGTLEVRVADDGRGRLPGSSGGVGLVSMRQRAEAVGGWLAVGDAGGGGTVVRAGLPAATA